MYAAKSWCSERTRMYTDRQHISATHPNSTPYMHLAKAFIVPVTFRYIIITRRVAMHLKIVPFFPSMGAFKTEAFSTVYVHQGIWAQESQTWNKKACLYNKKAKTARQIVECQPKRYQVRLHPQHVPAAKFCPSGVHATHITSPKRSSSTSPSEPLSSSDG